MTDFNFHKFKSRLNVASLILFFIFTAACSTSRKLKPEDLLIHSDRPLAKPMENISSAQVKEDIQYLLYALERGYAGKDYLPPAAYNKMIQRLDQISKQMNETTTPEKLKNLIDEILVDVPDSHLHARFNNQWSQLRDSKNLIGHVGNNFYKGSDEKPWKIEARKIRNKSILLISISDFPFHESSAWTGFLDQVQDRLPKSAAVILDLRGNEGGDDTMGLKLAWIFFGKNYRYPLSSIHERLTPETEALYTNIFGYRIAKNLTDNKKTDEFLLKRYQKHKEKFDKARAEKTDGYSTVDQSIYEWSGKMKNVPVAFNKPVYILMDQKCASSCESTIDAFEYYPQLKKLGENTAGYIHFGNVSPVILPQSKIYVQIGTHYAEYTDHRFIEKVGIQPDVHIKSGVDALEYTLKLINTESK